ncbi:hypothetical protein ACFW4M_10230 [Streptomyces sp. NPDC058794]|uniref:hypothetical protein n=1 Tax=unclassified Streptomyces TaxID=2593676 RepID=UPI003675C162
MDAAENTAVGQTLQGRATELVPFGAFGQVTEDFEGLVHLRELALTEYRGSGGVL